MIQRFLYLTEIPPRYLMMQQFIHFKTDSKEVVCHVMILECGAQGGFILSASFLPSLDPKQDKKRNNVWWREQGVGKKNP